MEARVASLMVVVVASGWAKELKTWMSCMMRGMQHTRLASRKARDPGDQVMLGKWSLAAVHTVS